MTDPTDKVALLKEIEELRVEVERLQHIAYPGQGQGYTSELHRKNTMFEMLMEGYDRVKADLDTIVGVLKQLDLGIVNGTLCFVEAVGDGSLMDLDANQTEVFQRILDKP